MSIKILFKTEHLEWVDVTTPTPDDLTFLHKKYGINQFLLEDTTETNHLPKYEEVDGVRFFLTRECTDTERRTLKSISDVSTKLGIFVLKNAIITTHRMPSKSIDLVLDKIDKKEIDISNISINILALQLAHQVIKTFDDECIALLETIDNIENEVFLRKTNHSNVIRRLYRQKRKTGLNIRVLNMSTEWITAFRNLELEPVEIQDLIDKQKDVLADFDHLINQTTSLISMFIALSDQKANQVMKVLAIYSVYFLPITFIAGVYGMNFANMPELHHPYSYFITLGAMALIVIITFIYFQRKKW